MRTRKNVDWRWGDQKASAFITLKEMLSTDIVLAHLDPFLPIGILCDASSAGIGAVLFHRFPDGSEQPIANVSKSLSETQRKFSQIQKEALSMVFALRKFHRNLYACKFILVTDHMPLLALFNPNKATPALAANRLARWVLMLGQYSYTIEHRRTSALGNADALSRLPDEQFDGEEEEDDIIIVNASKTLSVQLKPTVPETVRKESAKDPTVSTVMRYTLEGWPEKRTTVEETEDFWKVADYLSVEHGCLLYGARVVIPKSLRKAVLDLLNLGHFGIEKIKQLARTAVY